MGMNVLFVDDESNVLSGLRRLLRGQRSEWDMEFASSGSEALQLMEKRPVDVIVSDMRMPHMNGAELLAKVAKDYPKTVRLILSGQSENEKILRSIGPAHQFLSKPCDPDVLIATIQRACGLQNQLQHPTLRQVVAQISFLPSLPALYRNLVHELESDSSSMEQIGAMIGGDIAMSAKVLQLVNSSFFGLAQHVSCPKHAVALLGLNVIRPLVLLAGAYSQCDNPDLDGYSLEKSIQHSLSVATLARKIASSQSSNNQLIDDSFIAGMMHDIGKLILAVNMRERYQEILLRARDTKTSIWRTEIETLGTSHAEIGAYLLTLWGFPNSIVEAVAWHHQPSLMPSPIFSPLTAVHFANALLPSNTEADQEEKWDRDYMAQLDTKDTCWSDVAQQFANFEIIP
jgi:putative nucleotidyltransferase with HDIG domain